MLIFTLIWVVGVVDDGFGLICMMSARFVLIFGFNYAVGVDMLWLLGLCLFFYLQGAGFRQWLVWFEGDQSLKVVLCPFDLIYSPSLTINFPWVSHQCVIEIGSRFGWWV